MGREGREGKGEEEKGREAIFGRGHYSPKYFLLEPP